MGAYDNPQILVDTQTGQHFRNLQESITKSVIGFGEDYAIKQKEIADKLEKNKLAMEKTDREAEEYAFALRTGIGKLKSSNDKLNIADTFEPLIQEAVKLKTGLLNNSITGKDRQIAMQKLADINASVSGDFSTSLADLSSFATTLEAARLKGIGAEGGIAKDLDPNDYTALQILQGKLEGTKEAIYEGGDPNKLLWRIKKDGVVIKEYSAAKLKKIDALGNDYLKINPDLTAQKEALKVNNTNIFEVSPVDPKNPDKGVQSNGRIADAYLEKNPDGSIKYDKVYIGDSRLGKYKLVARPLKEDIKRELSEQISSQLAGLTDEELMLYTNNVVDSYRKKAGLSLSCMDSDNVLSPEERANAIEMYKDYFVNTQIAEAQDVLKEDSSVLLLEEKEAAPFDSKKSNNKNDKPTAEEKKLAAQAADIAKTMKTLKQGQQKELKYGERKIYYDGSKWIIPAVGDRAQVELEFKKAAEHYLLTGFVDKSIK